MKEETGIPQMQQEDDQSLVRIFQADREDAFDSLLLRYKDRVFNICYRFLGDYQESDDTAQEIWVKVYRFLKGFRLEARFSTWLFRITINACKNKLSSAQYRDNKKIISLSNSQDSDTDIPFKEMKDNSHSPLKEIERKEKLRLIQKAIDSLSQDHKTVIILRDIEGMSYDEIVQITGDKPGTVKSRLARARLELRKKLIDIL
jgi:RNA polymerase sigma-70 factor (ECF subfamily)